jgi:hypothetical protein
MVTPLEMWANAQALPATNEAEYRTKISRSYYALYSHACQFNEALPAKGELTKFGSGMHGQLSQKLTNPNVADENLKFLSRSLGTKQGLAHELRVLADYQLNKPVTIKELSKCMRFVQDGMNIPLP